MLIILLKIIFGIFRIKMKKFIILGIVLIMAFTQASNQGTDPSITQEK